MTRCKIKLERKYSGSLYKYWTDVSVDELIRAGVKVYFHVNWYDTRSGLRCEDLEEKKWKLAKDESSIEALDYAWAVIKGEAYEGRVMIYFDIKDDQLWKEVQVMARQNEDKEHEYWKEFRESGKADQCAIERGWALMGADPEWYDRQTNPNGLLA